MNKRKLLIFLEILTFQLYLDHEINLDIENYNFLTIVILTIRVNYQFDYLSTTKLYFLFSLNF